MDSILRFEKQFAAIPIPRSNPRSTKWCAHAVKSESEFTDLRLEVGAAHAGNAEPGRRSRADSSNGRVMLNRFITKEFFK